MRVVNRLFGLVAASVLVAGAAEAQSCMGYPSFGSAGKNVSVTAAFPEGITSVGAQLNVGKAAGLFYGVNAGWNSYDDLEESSISFGGILGSQMGTGKVSWCPILTADFEIGPEIPFLGDASSQMIAGGISGAFELAAGSAVSVSPFANARFAWMRVAIDDADDTETAVLYGVGLAFKLSNGIIIAPALNLSSLEDSDPVVSVRFSLPLGGM